MNLIQSNEPKNFYVYINPNDPLININLKLTGSFISTPINSNLENLMFIPNPDFQGFTSPFQNNLMRDYRVEYGLEIERRKSFPAFPSRLESIFLFDTEEEAIKYSNRHPSHVGDRQLKRAKSHGEYVYSKHDSSWIDFMRINQTIDLPTFGFLSSSYWEGKNTLDYQLESHGKPWASDLIKEFLFLGKIDF